MGVARDQDRVSGLGDGQGGHLVGMGGAAGGVAAPVRAPEPRPGLLRRAHHAAVQLDRVETAVERDVRVEEPAELGGQLVGSSFVARDGERRQVGVDRALPGVRTARRRRASPGVGVRRRGLSASPLVRRSRSPRRSIPVGLASGA